MASEREIAQAKELLSQFKRRIGSRRSRIHDEAIESNFQRQRALNGLCGNCLFLKIYLHGEGRGSGVQLFCTKGYIPVVLYTKTPIGEKANCPDHTQKNLNPSMSFPTLPS